MGVAGAGSLGRAGAVGLRRVVAPAEGGVELAELVVGPHVVGLVAPEILETCESLLGFATPQMLTRHREPRERIRRVGAQELLEGG